MHPLVREVNLHTIDVVHFHPFLSSVHRLDLCEDSIHVGGSIEVNAVFGDGIIGIGGTELADSEPRLCLTLVC